MALWMTAGSRLTTIAGLPVIRVPEVERSASGYAFPSKEVDIAEEGRRAVEHG
jgi:hypothetical protein